MYNTCEKKSFTIFLVKIVTLNEETLETLSVESENVDSFVDVRILRLYREG